MSIEKLFTNLECSHLKPIIFEYNNQYIVSILANSDHNCNTIYNMESEYASFRPNKRLGIFSELKDVYSAILDFYKDSDIKEETEYDEDKEIRRDFEKQLRIVPINDIDKFIEIINCVNNLSFEEFHILLKNTKTDNEGINEIKRKIREIKYYYNYHRKRFIQINSFTMREDICHAFLYNQIFEYYIKNELTLCLYF